MHNNSYALNPVSRALRGLDGNFSELDQVPSIPIMVPSKHLVALTDTRSVGAEKFQLLAIRLKNFQRRRQLKTLLITSSVKGEGKSVVSANLAVSLAQSQRTLLIDGDLHQSGLRDVLGSIDEAGLADWWRGGDPIVSFFRRVDGLALWYLAAGRLEEPPMEILKSQRFSRMLLQVAKWFDWVIIDSPPLVPVADSSLLATHTDGTLLVVRQGKTPKPLLQEALRTENLKLLGLITNEWEDVDGQYYQSYYKTSRHSRELLTQETHLAELKNVSLPGSTEREN